MAQGGINLATSRSAFAGSKLRRMVSETSGLGLDEGHCQTPFHANVPKFEVLARIIY
jgi:hypothetical protein